MSAAYQPGAALASRLRQLPEQAPRFLGTSGGSQFQPVTRLVGRIDVRLRAQPAVLELGTPIARTGSLAQQFVANAPVAGIVAVLAEHLPEPALGYHHSLAGGLLEQATGKVLDARLVTQTRAVQQPEGHLQREALGFGQWRWGRGISEMFTAKYHD